VSWDVFIQHLPASATRVADIPADFQPLPLGPRRDVMEAIADAFPMVRASDPTWFTIDDPRYTIEIAVSGDDPIDSVTLFIRGDASVVAPVARLIERLGARAIDSWTGEFFDSASAGQSLARWRSYIEDEG